MSKEHKPDQDAPVRPPRKRGGRVRDQSKSAKSRVKAAKELGVSKAEASTVALQISKAPFVVFDIETTGGNPERNGITEIFALKYQDGKVGETFYSMVNPKVPIPPIVRRMTGITNQMVRGAPLIEDVMPGFVEFLGDGLLVSHNTIGDLKFLRHFSKETTGKEISNFFMCSHLLVDKLFPETPDKSLTGLGKYFELSSGDLHRAEADAWLTLELFKVLCKKLDSKKIDIVRDAIIFQGDYESSLRLGWSVDRETINSLPESPGVFWLEDSRGSMVFASSAGNISRDVRKLQNWSQVPRSVLREAFKAVDIKYQKLTSNLESLLKECEILERVAELPDPIQWHQRRVHTLNLSKSKNKIRVSIGEVPDGAIAVYGPIRDRKVLFSYLSSLAESFDQDASRKGFSVPLSDLETLLGHITGDTELAPPEPLLPLHQMSAWLIVQPEERKKIGFGLLHGRMSKTNPKKISADHPPQVTLSPLAWIKLILKKSTGLHRETIPPLSSREAQIFGAALWWACVGSNRREGDVIAVEEKFSSLTRKMTPRRYR